MPILFRLAFRVVDYPDGDPVEGVEIKIACASEHEDLVANSTTYSDGFGYVTTEPLRSGVSRITISKEMHEDAELELELPGQWTDELTSNNLLDLGVTDIVRITSFKVQLSSTGRSRSYDGYRVSHTHKGHQFSSKLDGQVDLQLGVFSTPLYLKVWYPDDHVSIRYLDGGMPLSGESHPITTHTSTTVEVDLDCSNELRSALDSGEFTIAASFNASNGDAVKNTRDVKGSGVYEIHGADSRSATISVERVLDGWPTTWAMSSIELPDSGVVSVPIRLESTPTNLKLIASTGVPLVGASLELRTEPDLTGWTAGGTTNAEGEVKMPRSESHGRLRGSWVLGDQQTCYAIGIPFDMSLPGDDRTVRLGELVHPKITVHCEDGPIEEFSITLGSPYCSAPYVTLDSNGEGVVEGFGLTNCSTAVAHVSAEGVWFPKDPTPLTGSTTRIRGYRMGTLIVTEQVRLSAVTSEEFHVSLDDWFSQGSIAVESMPDMARRARVPVGSYTLWDREGVAIRTLAVEVGEELRVGSD